ncbi:sensor histidine kinase [Mobiluncus curtisii]|uniref:sensor histidine kinase n=1 Tax=Mobiluncus curtisii TaxID=2051 RepID=UPI0001E0BD3B|nr:HAMP domain-containing sensor histidine kinase [Mobiluncus curtisii]EFL93254.1 ATPase/histidine kinase/DNA gyrase B/HSP90 domain protein [Mobiluncus curtisii subsp. curtisii ATCC 35241]QQT13797.1 HAMP domain-containing histidine kinase [Mobiluncus curtisii]STY76482.1 Phosphate regulon sensor protein phoR [Mobiluncus curtisii subsp. curtisii]
MKSVPKLIHRFISIFLLSSVLIILLNIIAFVVLVANYAPSEDASPYTIARATGKALQVSSRGEYDLSDSMSTKLTEARAWAILIDNETLKVIWRTPNTPQTIPNSYTLSDIADLSTGYLDGYPTYTGRNNHGVVVVGFPHHSFWKHAQPSWNYSLISNFPQILLSILSINVLLILGIYLTANTKFLKSVNPITKGIQQLSRGESVSIPETGVLSELAANINSASDILQQQREQLRKKETARANWIAGVSHDIRTPLSMVMGFAGQLENSPQLSVPDRKKVTMIIKQSERMKNLIRDLNLASKLDYNMQPLMIQPHNVVAIVRQTVVDFINMDLPDGFSIKWLTDENLASCNVNVDQDLLQRALSNLLYNSISHNENGCTIYVSVSVQHNNCIIRVEDDGIGVSAPELEQLNHTLHYMICDTSTTEQRHGLGLLIVRQIIDAHKGTVTISPSKHGGLKVTLSIPQQTI